MAEKTLQKVKEQLTCTICLDKYSDPKLLQCFHAYCQKCLVRLVRGKEGQLTIPCPSCRENTPIPDSGVGGLKTAFHINSLLEIMKQHKGNSTAREVEEKTVSEEKGNKQPDIGSKKRENIPSSSFCPEHSKSQLEYYCETCEQPVCLNCVLKPTKGKHCNHDYIELNEAYEKYKNSIPAMAKKLQKQLTTVSETLMQLDARCREVTDQRETLESNIHITFRRIHEALDSRKTELISELHQVTQEKLKHLSAQKDMIETTQAQLNSALYFITEGLNSGTQEEVMMMKANVEKRVNELGDTLSPEVLQPVIEADVEFDATDQLGSDIRASCNNYGKISLPDSSKSYVTLNCDDYAEVGKEYTAILQVNGSDGQPWEKALKSVECEVESEITGKRISSSKTVEKLGPSKYEFKYKLSIKGRHKLYIRISHQNVRGSPFHLKAKSKNQLLSLDSPISVISGIKDAVGVIVSKNGEVMVTQWRKNCVTVLTQAGKKLFTFGSSGHAQGQFDNVHSLAQDKEGNILLTDWQNHRLQKFSVEGKFILSVGAADCDKPLQIQNPAGIGYNIITDKVYVCDEHNACVHILNSDLTVLGKLGEGGSKKRPFCKPWGVAFDSTGTIYVTDPGAHDHGVIVFAANGKKIRKFGSWGTEPGTLGEPFGIAVDKNNYVYIVERANHRISVFTSKGEFIKLFSTLSLPSKPFGITIDDCGIVFVAESTIETQPAAESTGCVSLF